MIVETHAFKGAFVRGETSGFVVCAESSPSPGRLARPVFAEIYGSPNRYHIFETRAAAEFQLALAATGNPPVDGLSVREVRVENIRDYQTLAGFKTVFLVNRHRQATESLRVGDLPLTARINTPIPFPNRDGLRLERAGPVSKPPTALAVDHTAPAPTVAATREAEPARPARRPMRLDASDLVAGESAPTAATSPVAQPALRPGLFRRLLRLLVEPLS